MAIKNITMTLRFCLGTVLTFVALSSCTGHCVTHQATVPDSRAALTEPSSHTSVPATSATQPTQPLSNANTSAAPAMGTRPRIPITDAMGPIVPTGTGARCTIETQTNLAYPKELDGQPCTETAIIRNGPLDRVGGRIWLCQSMPFINKIDPSLDVLEHLLPKDPETETVYEQAITFYFYDENASPIIAKVRADAFLNYFSSCLGPPKAGWYFLVEELYWRRICKNHRKCQCPGPECDGGGGGCSGGCIYNPKPP